MKRIKMLCFLLAFVFLFSGCTAKYEITIAKDQVDELLNISNKDSSTWQKSIGGMTYRNLVDSYTSVAPPAFESDLFGGDELTDAEKKALPKYHVEKTVSSDELGIQFDYTFSTKDYPDSSALNYYLDDLETELTEDNVLKIETASNWSIFKKYEDLDAIDIILHTNYDVLYQNADQAKDGTFQWHVTRDYIKNSKGVLLHLNLNKTRTYIPNYVTWILLVLLIGVGSYFGYRFYQKSKEENRI